jgi:vacuolar-type H+-ATPase subunit H
MVAFSKLPVMMSDEDVVDKRYENAKIYVVRCKNDDTLVYVGSTITTLGKRFTNHKISKKCSLYKYVNGDWDNWFIELYEEYPCKNKYQLRRREGELIRQIATINKVIPGRTLKQYRQDNRDKLLEQLKQHYQDNREVRLEKQKQHYQDNREKIKEYYQDNRDEILEQKKQYYRDNCEKIVEKHKQKIACDICGSIVSKGDIATHKKTKKCINYKK